MSATAAALTASWTVGRWRCTLTVPQPAPGQQRAAAVEWEPVLPDRRLTPAEVDQYRRGRDSAMRELAAQLGGVVALIEL